MSAILRKGSTTCPRDKTPLHWELIGGMRVFRELDGLVVYEARCPHCNRMYRVNRGPTP